LIFEHTGDGTVHFWRPELAIKEITVKDVMSSLMIDKNNDKNISIRNEKENVCTYTHM
jgi:hypothetical protein